jgi:ADP-heptose:LPS heptosyltransferase
VAHASGLPTLCIYGSSRPESWGPPGDPRHQAIRSENLSCIACQKNDCQVGLKCLEDLGPDAVFAKLEGMLKGTVKTL